MGKSMTDERVLKLLNPKQHGDLDADPTERVGMTISLDLVKPSDLNPRQSANPKYDEIKESIRTVGLKYPPNITRRPGDERYMVADGGNTRLQILKELYEETKDQKYFEFQCNYIPWVEGVEGSIKTIADHMIENELRGGTLFIDRALAAAKLRTLYEQVDPDVELSRRELARRISLAGWTVDPTNLGNYEYAVKSLLEHLPVALWAGAGHPTIKKLKKLFDCGGALCKTYDWPDGLWQTVWPEILQQIDSEKLDLRPTGKVRSLVISVIAEHTTDHSPADIATHIGVLVDGEGDKEIVLRSITEAAKQFPPTSPGTSADGASAPSRLSNSPQTKVQEERSQSKDEVPDIPPSGGTSPQPTDPASATSSEQAIQPSPQVKANEPPAERGMAPEDRIPALRAQALSLAKQVAQLCEQSVDSVQAHIGCGYQLVGPAWQGSGPQAGRVTGTWTWLYLLQTTWYQRQSPPEHQALTQPAVDELMAHLPPESKTNPFTLLSVLFWRYGAAVATGPNTTLRSVVRQLEDVLAELSELSELEETKRDV